MLEARKELPDLEHVIVVDGDGAARASLTLDGRRGRPTPTSTSRPSLARGRAGRPAHADLHLRHDRAAEGRRSSRTRNMMAAVAADRGDHRASRGRHGHLLAAHRRTSPSATPTTTSRSCSPARSRRCDEPARGHRLPAGGAAELVLRRPAHLGEAQGGPRDDAAPASPRSSARRSSGRSPPRARRCASSRPARRCPPSSPRTRGQGRRGVLRRPAQDARPRRGRSPSTSAPRPRRVEVLEFFHAIGLRAGRALGHVRDLRARAPATARATSRSAPSARRRRASRSSSPTTARC